jgi:hypothetical protein
LRRIPINRSSVPLLPAPLIWAMMADLLVLEKTSAISEMQHHRVKDDPVTPSSVPV